MLSWILAPINVNDNIELYILIFSRNAQLRGSDPLSNPHKTSGGCWSNGKCTAPLLQHMVNRMFVIVLCETLSCSHIFAPQAEHTAPLLPQSCLATNVCACMLRNAIGICMTTACSCCSNLCCSCSCCCCSLWRRRRCRCKCIFCWSRVSVSLGAAFDYQVCSPHFSMSQFFMNEFYLHLFHYW